MKKTIVIIAALAVLLVVGFFAAKLFDGNPAKQDGINDDVREFTIKAFRFGYSPDIITVNKGDRVKINIENTDTTHGIRIPELGLKGEKNIEFTANMTGEFAWYCTVYCGEGHMAMSGKLVIGE